MRTLHETTTNGETAKISVRREVKQMLDWMKGKKTYFVALAGVAYTFIGWFFLGKEFDTRMIFEMLSMITVRAGISKINIS